jgi:YD repeat-containing protein
VTNFAEYDAQGRVVRTIDALGNSNQTFYTPLGKVDYTIDKLGNTNRLFYDARGNLVQSIGPDGLATQTVKGVNP